MSIDVPVAGEEGCEGRDAGTHVDNRAAGREVLHDQVGRHGVLPKPGHVIGKETEGPLPIEPQRQQRERIGVAIDDRRQGGGAEVTGMGRRRRPQDHERRDPVLLPHRVDSASGAIARRVADNGSWKWTIGCQGHGTARIPRPPALAPRTPRAERPDPDRPRRRTDGSARRDRS